MFVKAGLTRLQVLQTATINPAIFFEKEQEAGAIEKGKFADLIILDANPLLNIENPSKIDAVIANGKYQNRQKPSLTTKYFHLHFFAAHCRTRTWNYPCIVKPKKSDTVQGP